MPTAEERPYHIQAIYDLKADHSPDHFRFAIGECRRVIAQLVAEDNSSDQQVARVHILRYLDLQLSRAVRWVEDEADLMAIVLRSQIELRLWADFVSKGPREAADFLHETQARMGRKSSQLSRNRTSAFLGGHIADEAFRAASVP
jgi:hypothetical protein